VKILKSYAVGIGEATRRSKMVFLLWIVNIFFGSIVYFLSSRMITDAVGRTVLAEDLVKSFDFRILSDLLVHQGQEIKTIFFTAGLALFAFSFITLFLKGGILFSLMQPVKTEAERAGFARIFFQGGGKFFGRFFRLCVYSSLLWLVFALLNGVLHPLGRALTARGAREGLSVILFWVRFGIAVFLFLLLRMILDYARIRIVVSDTGHVFKSLWWAVAYVFRRIGKTLALYYLVVITGAVVCGFLYVLKIILPAETLLPVIMAFIVGQVFIAARGWVLIFLQAAQLKFHSLESL